VHDDVYEASFGFTPRAIVLIAVALLLAAAGLLPTWEPGSVVRIADLVVSGGGALVLILIAASGKVALRVDWTGVTLGGSPLRYAKHTVVVPWSDIVGVELWVWRSPVRIHGHRTKMSYVTLHRRPGAPQLPGASRGGLAGAVTTAAAGIPVDLLNSSRPVNLWKLDRARFVGTVGRYAPHLTVRVSDDFPK
jgi:hypothetical protein